MDTASSYIAPRWPRAIWDISGAFMFDRDIQAFYDFCKQVLGLEKLIAYVHGSPALIWNSGRVPGKIIPHGSHAAALRGYAQRGMSVLLTASNTILTSEHINNKIANDYCDALNRKDAHTHNGVIISSDLLNAHIKQHYPHLQRISSILKITKDHGKGKLDLYKRYLNEFDLVMLHPDDVYDTDFLATLPEPERFIALINEYCIRGCPIRHLHYKHLSAKSLDYLGYDDNPFAELQAKNKCSSIYQMLLHPTQGTLALSHDEIATLHDLGFRHFKVQGRGMVNAVSYLVDLMRLLLRCDDVNETAMHSIRQLFWESYHHG